MKYEKHLMTEKKEPLELGKGLYLQRVGHDNNGNWSYWVIKGTTGRAKKVQAVNINGGSNKITKDDLKAKSLKGRESTVKGIIDYYFKYIDK